MTKQESNKKYREKNKDKISEYNKKYYRNNPDKIKRVKCSPEKNKEYIERYRKKRKLERLKIEDLKFIEFVRRIEE